MHPCVGGTWHVNWKLAVRVRLLSELRRVRAKLVFDIDVVDQALRNTRYEARRLVGNGRRGRGQLVSTRTIECELTSTTTTIANYHLLV